HAGNILVSDSNNGRVQKFAGAGGFLAVFGKTGRNQGEFSEPNGIAVDSKDNLYVADVTNHRVQKLSRDGRFLAEWKGPASGVYVGDPHHGRIQVFDTKVTFLSKWTVSEWQASGWSFQDLWFDAQRDRLYAISPATDEILVFDEEGKRLPSLKPKPPAALDGAS